MEVLLGEKHLSQQRKGETAAFSEFISQKSSFQLGRASLFPVHLNDVRPWTLHGWGEQQQADLQQPECKNGKHAEQRC